MNPTAKRDKTDGERWAYERDGRNRLVRRAQYSDGDAASPDRVTIYTYGPLGRRWLCTRAVRSSGSSNPADIGNDFRYTGREYEGYSL